MTGSAKRKTLMLLGLVVLFTVMIAVNLPQLEFQPGMPLPKLEHGQLVLPVEENRFVSISSIKFLLILVVIFLTGATLYTAYQLFRGIDWKLILYMLRYGMFAGVILGCLVFMVMLFPGSESYTPVDIVLPTPAPVVTSPVEPAPPSLLWLVGIGLLVTIVFVLSWIIKPAQQPSPMELVALEAEKARQALRIGTGLKDVVIDCYLKMSLALKQERGLEREDFMTTGEFEDLLHAAGFPREPVHQLTRLFDAVRYGHWQPNAADEQTAIQCLEAIMLHGRPAAK